MRRDVKTKPFFTSWKSETVIQDYEWGIDTQIKMYRLKITLGGMFRVEIIEDHYILQDTVGILNITIFSSISNLSYFLTRVELIDRRNQSFVFRSQFYLVHNGNAANQPLTLFEKVWQLEVTHTERSSSRLPCAFLYLLLESHKRQ